MKNALPPLALLLLTIFAASACAPERCPGGTLEVPERAPRFVVVRSDQGSSSALALLDGDGELLDDDWVNSGTRVSSLVTGLSGDVVVPSTALGGVAWLDRYGVDVLTIAEPGGPLAQIDLLGAGDTHDGFTSNPHDAIRLADGRLLVSRHNPNLSPDASALSQGNDVIVIEEGRVTASIDLHADDGEILARPDVLLPLRAGERSGVLVTLTRLGPRFQTAGPGAALVLDDRLLPSAPVAFGALENCVSASVDPEDPSRAYVLCAGLAYGATEEERRPHAGIVEVTLSADGTLSITGMATPDASAPVPTNGLVALGGRRVIAVAYGNLDSDVADRLVEIDVAAGTAREILRTGGAAFVLGDGTFDAAHGIALVPDAETSSVLRIDAASASLVGSTEIGGCLGLPPREIGPL